jgi:hypothetical protein
MAFSLKQKIFSLFGHSYKVNDSYKDIAKKGLYERLLETLGEEYDDYNLVAISDLIDNTIVPNRILIKFITYQENQIGAPYLTDDIEIRRKLLRFLIPIYKIKGTKTSYETMFRLFGFDVDFFIESTPTLLNFNNLYMVTSADGLGTATHDLSVGKKFYVQNNISQLTVLTGDARLKRETILDFYKSTYSFDDGNLPGGGAETINTKFDDPVRTFDLKCASCSGYIIRLFGPMVMTQELHNAVFKIIQFLEPINARLFIVYYNDVLLMADDAISIWIDNEGDLFYNNSAVPEVLLSLNTDGDGKNEGVTIGSYELYENGDLIFTN